MAEGTQIAKAYVQIIPSATGIQSKLTQEMGGNGQEAGRSFGSSLVSMVKKAIAAAGFGTALKAAISEGADLQQSLGGVETLFKDSADAVKAAATDAYKTAGMSANDYMTMVTGFSASLIQSLGGDTQRAADIADMAMVDMSDNANKMGTDMESIQNAYQGFAKQNYTMLDNLKIGYGGTQAEMKRLLKDAQKITGVKYDINNLADVYSAIHVIQTELGITGTTAKEASETISGSAQSMKAAWSNLLGNLALGEDITPALTALEDTVFTFLRNLLPAAGSILAGLPQIISGALGAAVRGLNLSADNTDAMVQFGVDLVTGIGGAIITAAPYLLEAGWNLLTALGQSVLTYDWTGMASGTIASLRESMDIAAGEILGTDGNLVGSVLAAISNGLPDILQAGYDLIKELGLGLWNALPDLLMLTWELMLDVGQCIMEMGPELIDIGMELLWDLGKGLVLAIPELLMTLAELSIKMYEKFLEYDWQGLGRNIIEGLINGMGAMGGALWTAAKNLAKKALNAIKSFLGIKSPSRRMRDEVGKFVPLGVAAGITENLSPVSSAMDTLAGVTASRTLRTRLQMGVTASATAAGTAVRAGTSAGVQVTVRIENFHNHTEKDLDELVEYVQAQILHQTERSAMAW